MYLGSSSRKVSCSVALTLSYRPPQKSKKQVNIASAKEKGKEWGIEPIPTQSSRPLDSKALRLRQQEAET